MNLLKRVFLSRSFLVLLGLIVVTILVWFVGPLVAIGRFRPLESAVARGLLIALILLCWMFMLVLHRWRQQGLNERMMDSIAGGSRTANEEVSDLRKRFDEALVTLKKTGVGSRDKQKGLSLWGSKQFLYQLPWYVFIGPPGSGKTTALINSGLQFPLAEKFGMSAIRGVGGTRSCDWWFTNEAVLLDTAGRYTTQESNELNDRAEWEGFLTLLKKYRKRQPINGVLLTVSVPELMGSEVQRGALAAQMRRRLDELNKVLAIEFPVYLLVTKSDLMAGFNEYFGMLSKEQRSQVWGFTLPYAEERALSSSGLRETCDHEFALLLQRLNDRLPEVLISEQDLNRRSLSFSLPQQFASLKPSLGELVDAVFSGSVFNGQPMLRGVYFTSGTQEGTPFDRVMGALNRVFRVDGRVPVSAPGSGKSFFLQDLMRRVIFPEAHLAGRDRKAERRERLFGLGAHALIALALAGCTLAWAVSSHNNEAYLAEVGRRQQVLEKELPAIAQIADDDLVTLKPVLDQARDLAKGASFPVDEPDRSYTFGLYQGDKLQAAGASAYRRMLEDALLPRVARRVENLLRTVPADNLELSYETLKAYLMLHDPAHYDGKAVSAFVLFDWERTLSRDVSKEDRAGLAGHLAALFCDGHPVVSPFPIDQALVAQTRESLARFSLAQRAFSRLERKIGTTELPPFTIAAAAGAQAPLVFTRASGQPLTQGIPGLYSYRGYHEIFKKEVVRASALLQGEESWVMGQRATSVSEQAKSLAEGQLVTEIKRLYLLKYAKLWEDYLNDLRLVHSASLGQSIMLARTLSGPDSPLAQFLRAAVREVTLLRDDKAVAPSLVGQARAQLDSARDDLQKVVGSDALPANTQGRERVELIVDSRFEGLRQLVGQGGKGAPLDASLALVNDLYTNLAATDAALKAGSPAPAGDVAIRVKAEAARLPAPMRGMLEGLANASTAQTDGQVRSAVASTLNGEVGEFCRKAIAGRYPVARGAGRDITPDDFTRMFGPGGLMDSFFSKNLAPMVDMSTSPWSLRQSSGRIAEGGASLGAFQKAATIRDVFFRGGGHLPQVGLDIKVSEMDPALSQLTLDVDGQVFKYAHGPQLSQRINWPGGRGSNQVRLQVVPAGASSGLLTEGPWALYRFFDKLQVQPGNSPEKFTAALNLDGHRIVFDITAGSVQNPFRLHELQGFSCPGRL